MQLSLRERLVLYSAARSPDRAVRRRAAALLFLDSHPVAEVARAFRVTRPTVYGWLWALRWRHRPEDLRTEKIAWRARQGRSRAV